MKILKNQQTVIAMNKFFKEVKTKQNKKKKVKASRKGKFIVFMSTLVILMLAFAFLVLILEKNVLNFRKNKTTGNLNNNRVLDGSLGLNCTFNKCFDAQAAADAEFVNHV